MSGYFPGHKWNISFFTPQLWYRIAMYIRFFRLLISAIKKPILQKYSTILNPIKSVFDNHFWMNWYLKFVENWNLNSALKFNWSITQTIVLIKGFLKWFKWLWQTENTFKQVWCMQIYSLISYFILKRYSLMIPNSILLN